MEYLPWAILIIGISKSKEEKNLRVKKMEIEVDFYFVYCAL